ncbi:S8 family peptidase [Streptomyces zagrosensis]|uniref:Subtilisin family serine protease n=1 Tax=Streptomyces zagrosensis TaxID=1042984 RepID=A0A7W9QDH4_9ACTN|nr:S8 family peptidase [Streptomyces zagrosensis]MBB5937738.1 subtilisin family serine protease [Streptomyces zagrosensis]
MARTTLATALALTLVATGGTIVTWSASASPGPATDRLAPLHAAGPNAIDGRYIVVLKQPAKSAAQTSTARALTAPKATAQEAGGTVRREYTGTLQGFSADLPPAALDEIRRDPAVAYVQPVRIHRQEAPAASQPATKATQKRAPWHLDRIDQRKLPLDTSYTPKGDAAGVPVYVLDSGIRASHKEFGGRASGVYSAIKDGKGTKDCANHGTFVASHIAGKTYGVAKKAKVRAVRILGCDNSATTEEIIDGMNWTARHAPKSSVVNMSIQSADGFADQAMDDAAKAMINKGLILVFISGNFGKGDCQNSPKDPRAVTMGATTKKDARNTGSNPSSYGSCLTAFAPGAGVSGAGKDSDTHVLTGWNGTSFAAPLATGTIAIALRDNPKLTMAQAKKLIVSAATPGRLTNIGKGSPNRLLYAGNAKR